MPSRNKPTRYSESWAEPAQLFTEALREIDMLIGEARKSGDAIYYRSAIRSIVVYWEAFYSMALYWADCLLDIYYDLTNRSSMTNESYLSICKSCFNISKYK